MKKYLISGFNTVQEVKLEAGTYTLVAYAKSMYSNVYTFALGDGENWTEYDIDVVKGELCKVWLTFTIDRTVTKFKPIANNFSESLPVYVTDLQLTRGNIPVEAGASPFDVDKILNDLHDEIDGIEDFTNEVFADGLLNREEKTQLRASLDAIGSIVESVKGSYNKLLDNPFIHEDTMSSISTRYNALMNAWESTTEPRGLKPVILWIVNGDNIISQDERAEKDRALNAFNDALYEYNQAEKEVYNDVGASIDKAQADANVSLAKTKGFTRIGDQDFEDGLIFTSLMKLLDAGNDGEEMAGVSGIAGDDKEDPAFWAGGSYDQAIGGTAKAIIRHDGSAKFTDAEITGTVNATSGNVASLIIEQNRLLTKNRRIEIDGESNIITLKDANLKIRTIIHPGDIPSIGDYFDPGGSYNADLSYLNSNNFTGTNEVSLTIGGSSSETHELTIGGFDIETYLSFDKIDIGAPIGYAEASTIVQLMKDGVEMARLAEAVAGLSTVGVGNTVAYGGMQSRTFTVPGNATYSVRVVHSIQQPQGNATATSSAEIIGMTTMAAGRVVNRSEIGNNGMVIATSSLNYTYDVGGLFQVRRGNIGFQITSNGIKKSSNMDSPTPTWDPI